MGQASATLRRVGGGWMHWCPGCDESHILPDGWTFDGNVERPTFTPSFKHTFHRFDAYDARGLGLGERREVVCHYIVTAGRLNFCGDCFHRLSGQSVPIPALPDRLKDFPED